MAPSQLPPELLSDIFTRLAVKTLGRVRCVSKLWHSIVEDPCFAEAHYVRSKSRPKVLLLFEFQGLQRDNGNPSEFEAYSVDCPRESDDVTETSTYLPKICELKDGLRYHWFHPVEGLCSMNIGDSIRVWNPITGECLDLKTRDTKDSGLHVLSHIGFDPVEKKHKVLSIRLGSSSRKIVENRVFDVEDNCWRRAKYDHPPNTSLDHIGAVTCIDGVIFYACYGPPGTVPHLVAFHVRSERLQIVEVPEEVSDWTTELIEFDRRATLANYRAAEDWNKITMCLLEDVENQVWRHKTCVIPWREAGYDPRPPMKLHGGAPAGELVISSWHVVEEPFFFFLYNVDRNVLRRVEVQGLRKHLYDFWPLPSWVMASSHVESMYSPAALYDPTYQRKEEASASQPTTTP